MLNISNFGIFTVFAAIMFIVKLVLVFKTTEMVDSFLGSSSGGSMGGSQEAGQKAGRAAKTMAKIASKAVGV